MATITEKLAAVSGGIHYDDLPADVIEKTKTVILDSLGCAIGAGDNAPVEVVRELARDLGGRPRATILRSGEKTSAPLATLVNGAMIRYLDYNDTYMGRDPSHPSGNVATVLAVAEYAGKGGKDVIAALVAAYEVHLRLADHCGDPSLWLRGWDHSTNSAYGAAAASSRLLGLSDEQSSHALAIAGSQSNTLGEIRRGEISMIKATAEAKAASDGVIAAMLAQRGFTGPLRIFEGDYGYINILAASADVDSLVRPEPAFKIMKSSLKYHPVETMTQPLVEAALCIREEHQFDPHEIDRVVVGLYDFAFKKPAWDKSKLRPTTRESADHSYYYCVAVALLDGEVTDAQFTPERLFAADVANLMERVELGVDSSLDGLYPATYPGIVAVHMSDGRVFRKRVDHARGHPRNPGTRRDVEAKFRQQCARYMSEARIEQAIELIWHLEEVQHIGAVFGPFQNG